MAGCDGSHGLGGHGGGGLGKLSSEVALGNVCDRVATLGRIEQVGGHTRVKETVCVAHSRVKGLAAFADSHRLGRIHRVGSVHESLHVTRGHMPAGQGVHKKLGGLSADELASTSLTTGPHGKAVLLFLEVKAKGKLLGLALLGKCQTNPLARLGSRLKRSRKLLALQGTTQFKGGSRCGDLSSHVE